MILSYRDISTQIRVIRKSRFDAVDFVFVPSNGIN